MLAYDEARCPFCGAERPVELPWEVRRRTRRRPWSRESRRWVSVLLASLALLLLLALCSAGSPR